MTVSIKKHLPGLLLLAGILLLLFFRSFLPSLTLSVGDADLSVIRNHYRMLPTLFTGTWVATSGLGNGGAPLNPAPGFLLAWLVPFYKYVDVNAVFHLFLMGLGGYFFIHDCTRNRFASLAGGLFLMLQPHVLSHLQPGHVGHFIMAGWVPFAFLFTRRAVVDGGLVNWTLAGCCLGLMLAAGQHDVAAFFGLVLAAYGLFLLAVTWRKRTTVLRWLGVAGGVTVVGVVALLLAAPIFLSSLPSLFHAHAKATTLESAGGDAMSAEDKWLWATQWSVPPEEMLDAAVPGFFGWGSSDMANPYRGRIGQTEGWMRHHKGMPNLNDVCQYLGALALLAALVALVLRRRDPEVWFFAGAGVLAMILSFGKFGPLYRFFYAIPGMDALRNPIKWYYVTSLSAGILAGLGLGEALRKDRAPLSPLRAAILAYLPGLCVVLLAAFALARLEGSSFIFWQQKALVDFSARSIGLAFLFWSAAGGAVYLLLSRGPEWPRLRMGAVALALLVLGGELCFVNSHYMPYHPWEALTKAGPFNDFLAGTTPPYRFRFGRQDGLIGLLRSVAVMEGAELADPYASRLPDEFLLLQRDLESRNPLAFWRLCNVRYIVTERPLEGPAFKTAATLKSGPSTAVVNELKTALPRCLWISDWKAVSGPEALSLLADPAFDPGRQALIQDNPSALPVPPPEPDPAAACLISHYSWNRVVVKTTSTTAGLVVFLSRFDPDWQARVDGAPVPLWKADGLMQACPVPAGAHTVEFAYVQAAARPALHAVVFGWILAALLIGAGFLVQYRQARRKPA